LGKRASNSPSIHPEVGYPTPPLGNRRGKPGQTLVRLADFSDVSDLAVDKTAFPDDGRREPTPGAPPEFAEYAEVMRLDPTRVEFELNLQPAKRRLGWGPIGSLLLHLLPLLTIIDWPSAPAEIARPIPIRLVIEQPPPPPQPAELKSPTKPPTGRYASDDFANVEAPEVETGRSDPSPEPQAERPRSAETRTVLVAPPLPSPAPIPLSEQVNSDPSSSAAETPTAVVAHLELPPKATPPKQPTKIRTPLEAAWPLPLHEAPPKGVRSARLRGPDAIRDEYCAQALSLTMRHIGLLPLSLTGTRQGETVLSIQVLGDGTVNGVKVARSSGYPDIDERIERMVLAVSRFPPLPPWMGPSMDFTFQLHFPNKLQR
jgi:protein TonB